MPENNPKSKLKRKKSSVEDLQAVTCSRGTRKSSPAACRPAVGAAAWWNRQQPPGVEALWASTLRSALPNLELQHWDPVPDLPHPSPARASALQGDEQRWCSLSEEVAPLPEPSPPSPRTPSSPGPLRLGSSLQEILSDQTTPEPPDRPLSSHCRQSHDSKTTSLQAPTQRPRPSLRSWEGAGPSSVGEGSDSRVSLQGEGGNKEEVQRSVGGGGLQNCPMCLLEFPAGFTQMDCDGHLAQCLSEVNVDMIW